MDASPAIGGIVHDGTDGWSPIFAVVVDGERRVFQVVSWVGGTGSAPATGLYVADYGFTSNLAEARDLRGAIGSSGWSPTYAVVEDGERRVLLVTNWIGGSGVKPATGDYVGALGFTPNIAEATDIRGPAGSGGPPVIVGTYNGLELLRPDGSYAKMYALDLSGQFGFKAPTGQNQYAAVELKRPDGTYVRVTIDNTNQFSFGSPIGSNQYDYLLLAIESTSNPVRYGKYYLDNSNQFFFEVQP